MIKDIKSQLEGSDKPIVQSILKKADVKIMAIGLREKVELADHTAPSHAKIIVIQGKINYISKARNIMLSPLDEFDIPLQEVHKVIGIEDAIFLLVIHSNS